MYEAQQPPAYYFLLAPLYYVVKDVQLLERCWILRAASVLLASAVIPLGYLLALRCVQPEIGIGIVCVIAAMPELFISISRISNEFLAVPIGTLVLLLTVLAFTGRHGSGTGLGVVLGLALLTKAYFLAFVPVVALAQAWASQSHPLRRLTRTLAPIGIAVLFAGGWYVQVWYITGSLTGEQNDAALRERSMQQMLALIPQIEWLSAVDSTFLSHIWFGGWSFLQVRSWMYHFFSVLAAMAALGLGVLLVRTQAYRKPRAGTRSIDALIITKGCALEIPRRG